MAFSDLSCVYGEQYYTGYYERSLKWFNFFNHIADCLVEQYEPKSHLDAGCAWGLLVEVMRARGVQSFGVDFSAYALEQVHPDVQPYCQRGSLTEPIEGGPYDLITCIEVLEHMEEAAALQAIENMAAVSDVILFSSTPDGFDDPTHINVRPVLYWLRAFAKQGLYPEAASNAIFVSEHAFIVRKTAAPLPDEALQMFVQIMELRAETRRLVLRVASAAPAQEPSNDLEELLESPGWQFIRHYRSWLEMAHKKNPKLLRAWERGARLALKPLTVSRKPKLVTPSADWDYAEWVARTEPSEDDLAAQVLLANDLSYRPKFSVVMPVFQISSETLRAAIDSLKAQTYDNWELCASVIPSLAPDAAALLHDCSQEDPRIRICELEANLGISGNSNKALEAASGEFIALLDHDDTLAPFALYEAASLLNKDRAINFIYSDRDELSNDGATRSNPLFKAGWSPQILVSANYLTHLCILRTDCVRKLGGWRSQTDGAQDWDLFLRVTNEYGGVRHIPKILYHWRHAPSSVSATGLAGKPYAVAAQVRTVDSYCRDANLRQSTVFLDGNPKIVWRLTDLPSVSIIVLSSTAEADEAERIAQRPECETVEVLRATYDADASSEWGVKYVAIPGGANIVERASRLVAAANGDILVFVDAGIRLQASNWLRELAGPLSLPGVGLCGSHLLDDLTGEVQHVGMAFDEEGNASRVRLKGGREGLLHGAEHWLRNWGAASGACFAIQRSTWNEVGGFDAPQGHSRPDIRLCLKLAEKGLRVVTSPAARVRQTRIAALELPLQAQAEKDRQIVRTALPHGDPHINANLRLQDGILVPR